MLFFTGRAFIVIRHILKLVLQFQFDLQSPLKQPKMLIFEKWKNMVFGPNYGIFWPKGDLKPCIWVTYTVCLWFQSFQETFFFKSSKNGTFWAKLRRVKMVGHFCPTLPNFFASKIDVTLPPEKKFLDIGAGLYWAGCQNAIFKKKMLFSGRKRHFFKKFILFKNVQ